MSSAASTSTPADATSASTDAAHTPAKRHQMTSVLGIDISIARTASHMKARMVTAEDEAALTEKRAAHKAAVAAGDVAATAASKAEIDAINARIVRIGGDAPIAVAVLANLAAHQLLCHAMDQTRFAERKVVEVANLHAPGNDQVGALSSLEVWPLVCNLPAITTYNAANEEEIRRRRAEANKDAKAAREAAKEMTPEEAKAAKAAAAVAEDDEDASGALTTFHTYVEHLTKTIKADPKYETMRVSNRVREVISDLVGELVANLSRVSKTAVLDLLGVRTLTAEQLMAVVSIIYVNHSQLEASPGLASVLQHVNGKLAAYHTHMNSEKDRKSSEMSAEDKAALDEKKAASDKLRLQTRAAAAKKKAIAAAELAKDRAAQEKAAGKA